MFSKVFLRNQRHFFGKGAVLCLASAVVFPIVNHQYKVTRCETVLKTEVKVKTPVIEVEPTPIESSPAPVESESQNDDEVIVPVEADDEDDAAWVAEKQKCSFCKMFILSPCKKPFKNWSNCVDKAKAEEKDFADVCSEYTKALMNCTSEHSEYFQALEGAASEDEGQEEGEVEAGAPVSEAAVVAEESVEKKAFPGPSLDSVEDEK